LFLLFATTGVTNVSKSFNKDVFIQGVGMGRSVLRKIKIQDKFSDWFQSESEDLFVYRAQDGAIFKIEYCYDKPYNECALLIESPNRIQHLKVSDGEGNLGRHKETPIYLERAGGDANAVVENLCEAISHLSTEEEQTIKLFLEENGVV
jgi:hypothetical protein